MQAPTHQEFCCYCFIRRCLKAEAFLVLPRVRSQVNVRVRASTADDLIYQPDQAKGFRQDTQPGIVVTILRKLVGGTGGILAEEDAIRQLHVLPLPATAMTRLAGGKEAAHPDDLPAMLLDFVREQREQFAERSIRERASQPPVLEQSLEVEILHPNDPITVGDPGRHLVEHIISHAGDAIMEPCDLTTGFFPVL